MTKKQNKIFLISGPSGAGEDSVINGLRKKRRFNRIRTTITRQPRDGESQGRPYFFTTIKKFKQMIKGEEFVEWAVVYGDYRGATKKEVSRVLKLKRPVIWKVDWHGVKTIKKLMPESVAIFILPERYEILETRLLKRKKDTLKTIKAREHETKVWLKQGKIYDYKVINKEGQLDQTINKIIEIVKKEV